VKNLLRSGFLTASLLAAAGAQAAPSAQDPVAARAQDRVAHLELESATKTRAYVLGRKAYREEIGARWGRSDPSRRA